ncbi:5-exo-hydroxycamphor dehydrogenase-like [Homarus americanus]|uniref:5-exo-hydroxycamphor dehydrogenase-like n=1 Tax=Homarus americanus TaxID=6706 RepID=UPI001C445E15|nr:5-exo-hydroxycamphor dehydrogenase-like [Homarus americanus]
MSTPSPTPAVPEATHARSIVFLGRDRSPSFVTESTRLPSQLTQGQVLVKVELATICGSDLHTLNGTRSSSHPCVLGHEGCGVVVTSQREGVKPGDRVTWGICAYCNKCLPCSLHLQNKCSSLLKFGHTLMSSASLFGTYSTHVLCLPGTPIIHLPPDLKPSLAAPVNCAFATMINALSKLPPTPAPGQPGASVALVQGAGMLGVYCIALLREAGYAKVYCVDPNRTRLAKAAEFGAATLHPDHEEELIQADSIDVVFEACGNKQVVPRGVRALRAGGTYVLAGLVHPDSHLNLTAHTIILKCLTIIGVHNYTGEHLQQAVTFLNKHHKRYPFASLLGPTYPLSEFRNAVEVARTGQFFRVAINPHL